MTDATPCLELDFALAPLMFLVLVKSPLIHLLQAVVNNVFLDKVLMQCHTSPLTARMFLMVPKRIFSTKFAATFHCLDESSLDGTS
jgi:hypothetical protein